MFDAFGTIERDTIGHRVISGFGIELNIPAPGECDVSDGVWSNPDCFARIAMAATNSQKLIHSSVSFYIAFSLIC